MVAAREVDERTAHDALEQAALDIGLHPSEIRGTLRSGMRTAA
jgi:hypothetical protein